jgi:hypothetical protein
MQNKSNYKASQKSYTMAQPSQDDPFILARAAVANAMILKPKARAVELAEALLNESLEFQRDLNEALARNFYIAAYNVERRKRAAANRAQFALPGFEHLPLKIPSANGAPMRLLDANLRRVRDYYRSLTKGYDKRKKDDPRVKEAKALMQKLQKRSGTEKGITVRQVLLIG